MSVLDPENKFISHSAGNNIIGKFRTSYITGYLLCRLIGYLINRPKRRVLHAMVGLLGSMTKKRGNEEGKETKESVRHAFRVGVAGFQRTRVARVCVCVNGVYFG